MITIVLNAYNDERKLVCQLIQKVNDDEVPDLSEFDNELGQYLNEMGVRDVS